MVTFFSEHGSNGIIKQQLTALISNYYSELFKPLYTTSFRFRLRYRYRFLSQNVKERFMMARWQDDFAKFTYAGGQAGTFGVWFFPPARLRARDLQKLHFKLHPTPSFRHLIAQHPLTPIDTYRSSDRKRATVALLSFHCFA